MEVISIRDKYRCQHYFLRRNLKKEKRRKDRLNKKTLIASLAYIATLLLVLSPVLSVPATAPQGIPNKGEMTIASIGMPETVDPQWLYDQASMELAVNVYDTLLRFDWSAVAFLPLLATEVPSYGNGLVVDRTAPLGPKVTFPIRAGVKFHGGQDLTADDVEWTFERWMVFCRSGGPTWMIYEPLLGTHGYDHTNPTMNTEIDAAVEAVGNTVEFYLIEPYPLDIFFQVIAKSWAGILDKDWAQAQGCWNGDLSVDPTYPADYVYHDPPVSPLDVTPVMNGAGPYMLDYIDYTAEEWSVVKFDDYWQGWPAPGASGYLDRVTEITISLWSTRKSLFLSNTGTQNDLTYVPRENKYELDAAIAAGQVRSLPGLPSLSLSGVFFNFEIPSDSPYIGSGEWGTGIPTNFFADADTRHGFAHSFDWPTFITEVWLGEAWQPGTPLIKGLGFDDLYEAMNDVVKYGYDPVKATADLQAAHGGDLWANGFEFVITYNTGNVARETAAAILQTNVMALNPNFDIEVREVDWDTYLGDLVNYPYFKALMPLFIIGWGADYADPHNFFFPFMHTNGDFTYFQSFSNATVDAVIEAEITEPSRSVRYDYFEELMYMFEYNVPCLPLVQVEGLHFERTWVQGWYHNTIHDLNYYYLWKGLDGDINGDGTVDGYDLPELSKHWYPGPPIGPEGYDRVADVWPVMPKSIHTEAVDIMDVTEVASFWGDTEP